MKIERTNRTKNYKDFEVSKEVKLYKVTMPCSRCDGEMEFTGESFCTYPPCNIHECDKWILGDKESIDKYYYLSELVENKLI